MGEKNVVSKPHLGLHKKLGSYFWRTGKWEIEIKTYTDNEYAYIDPYPYKKGKNKVCIELCYVNPWKAPRPHREGTYWGVRPFIIDYKTSQSGWYLLIQTIYYRNIKYHPEWKNFYNFLCFIDPAVNNTEEILCIRVPSTLEKVDEALSWTMPAQVKKAEKEGRAVFRLYDMFFVEFKSKRYTIFDYELPEKFQVNQAKNEDKVVIRYNKKYTLHLPHSHFKPVAIKELPI